MEQKVKLLPPMMPNFISIETPPRPRQEGLQEGYKIRVCELTDEEAIQYGELMKQTFIEHHKEQVAREAKQNGA
jgi:hypothetical protein